MQRTNQARRKETTTNMFNLERKHLGPLVSLVVVVVIVFVMLVIFDVVPWYVKFNPERAPDAKGLIDTWTLEEDGAIANLEQKDGTFKKITLMFNDDTRVLHAFGPEDSERTFRRSKTSALEDGIFVEIYTKQLSPRAQEKVVDTIVYWE